MKKKLFIISIIIMVIGLIVVVSAGFNVDLKYKEHKMVSVPIGENFNITDVTAITDEIFGKNKATIETSGLYNDEIIISVPEVSDEQINSLKNKFNEKYSISQKIHVSIGEEYAVEDVQAIANEVFSKEDTVVNKTKDNESYAEIEANLLTEDDLDKLNSKINERYNLSNEASSISATNIIKKSTMPRVRLIDMAKQYLLYTIIATVLVLAYFIIRYRKQGISKVLINTIATLIFAELLYMAIIAITRVAINKLVIIAAFAIYLAVLTYLNNKFLKESTK